MNVTLAVYAVFFVILWAVFIRPASKRNKEMRRDQATASVGAEVMLTSGIFGRVASVDEDSAKIGVEIAPGVVIHVTRVAIANVTPEKSDEADDAAAPTDEAVETD
ncbi:hypothetical protein Back2_06180 [Nocardioides baekrokdamisoli]|uniref:Preprotein translocase subunit YajC n=1 Tax=Nocardioides baekrokdamisoli TaxID=1804624 RepID=A0A3G9IRT2_9ACTN|nr:preprotein translocase subunit YajC [Nocardioides baekrokdamisoli]BBH16331.1 hypothetical protein Back2_06180 [Nocardioides baekrokdamisoli]